MVGLKKGGPMTPSDEHDSNAMRRFWECDAQAQRFSTNDPRLLLSILDASDRLVAELQVYREGGVTEEILRRNNGSIKVGRGCVIVREDEWAKLAERVKEVEADNAALSLEIQHLGEYWNGNTNERAMNDACEHVSIECAKILNADHPGATITQRLARVEVALREAVEAGDRMKGWAESFTSMGANIAVEDVARWITVARQATQALEGE